MDHFCNLRVSLPGSQKYICKYLPENEIFFKNILGTIDSCKNQTSKISC